MTDTVETFGERYSAALADHVRNPNEVTLRAAYELGREAVSTEQTILDLAVAHHAALDTAFVSSPESERSAVTEPACAFFVESLSAFEMVQRGFREAHEAARLEQRHAAILRRLSDFLADTSVALGAAASLEEVLQLVVEQARELLSARRCHARLAVDGGTTERIEATSASRDGATTSGGDGLEATFVGWDGRKLGSIEVFDKVGGDFNDVDAEVLVHLAQMASAAVERAQLFGSSRHR